MLKRLVHQIRTSDLVSLLLFNVLNDSDESVTRDRLGRSPRRYAPLRQALSRSLTSRQRRRLWVGLEGRRVWGMASARMRSGPRAWEIDHLYLSPQVGESGADLLDAVSAAVAGQGAERLFLRLPAESAFLKSARHCGFISCVRETIYRRSAVDTLPVAEDSVSLRRKRPQDDFDLFRLYNATTPVNVRTACALTLEQWHDAREFQGGSITELVYESDQGIRGWISTSMHLPQAQIDLVVHPEERGLMRPLARAAVAALGVSRGQACLVSEYAIALQAAVEELEFSPCEEFRLLVKTMVVGVKTTGLASAITA